MMLLNKNNWKYYLYQTLQIIRLNGEIADQENLRRRLNNDASDFEREVCLLNQKQVAASIDEKKKLLDELDRAGLRADELSHKNRAIENVIYLLILCIDRLFIYNIFGIIFKKIELFIV